MDGFLGTGAPLAFDLIVVLLAILLPILALSILTARSGRKLLHRNLQIASTLALGVTVLFFEFEIRRGGGWKTMLASQNLTPGELQNVGRMLLVHLIFATTTPALWTAAIVTSSEAWTGERPARHRIIGRLAAADLTLTALTGWTWYYLAFLR